MSRGGKRLGAGSKPKWKHGKTKTIRVPVALADQILEVARRLDEGSAIVPDSPFTTIDLTGLTISQVRGRRFVFLSDLLQLGYEIKPFRLAEAVKREVDAIRP